MNLPPPPVGPWGFLTKILKKKFSVIYLVRSVASANNDSDFSVLRRAAAQTIVTY